MFSYFVLLSLLGISAYYAVWSNVKTKVPKCMEALNVLLVLFTFYGIALILYGNNTAGFPEIDKKSFLKYIYISLLPIYAFYGLTKQGRFSEKIIRFWVPVLIVVAFYSFIHYENQMLEELGKTAEEGLTNNQSYLFLAILPSLLFIERPLLRYAYLAICVIFIVISMKRGAMLVGFICLLWFIFFSFGTIGKKYRVWGIFAIILAGVITYNILYSELSDNAYFLMRYNDTLEGYSSGRDNLYTKAIHAFFNDYDVFSFLFGKGAYASLQVLGKFAHNDWLEILVCQGLIGFVIYIRYWFLFIKTSLHNGQEKSLITAFRMAILIMFMTSLYSMSYSSTPFAISMVIGYYLAYVRGYKSIFPVKHN